MNRAATTLVAVLTLAGLAIPGCGVGGGGGEVVIVRSVSFLSVPFLVAEEEDFWGREGLNVSHIDAVTGPFALDALLSGSAHFSTVGETPLANAAFLDHDLVIVATFASSGEHIRLIARRDRGITRPSGLRGKKIGVSFGTGQEFYLDRFLEQNGLSRGDIQAINILPHAIVGPLARGDLDAAVAWEPFLYHAKQQLGQTAIVFPAGGLYHLAF
ncbi:MAG: ABC transporter substrate-binding protein, partial [bacterium]|nr:ABC transporter substrate-binding protein [bacterium]